MRKTKVGQYTENHIKEDTSWKYLPEIKKEWKKRFNGTMCKEDGEKEARKRC